MRIENPVDITDQKALIDGILAESLQAAAARGHAALTAAITRYLGCDDWATIDIATRMQSIHYIDGIVEYHIDGKRLLMVFLSNIKSIVNHPALKDGACNAQKVLQVINLIRLI